MGKRNNNSETEAKIMEEELNKIRNNSCSIIKANFNSNKSIDELVAKVNAITNSLDVLINNAGTGGPKGMPAAMDYQKIDSMDYQIWREILEVNLLAPFKVATSFRKQISKSDKKTLIMMSSDIGSVYQNTFGG